jgi:hypothetical protein
MRIGSSNHSDDHPNIIQSSNADPAGATKEQQIRELEEAREEQPTVLDKMLATMQGHRQTE